MSPTASIVVADPNLAIGQTSLVTFTFSEAVTDFTLADVAVPNGALSGPVTSDNITWTATLTPTFGVSDLTNVITLDNTGVFSAASEPGVGTTLSNNYAIDTQAPTATISLADAYVGIDDGYTTATVVFSEAVTGLSVADFNILNTTVSDLQTSDNITYTVRLTPAMNGSFALSLPGGVVDDAAGNTNLGSNTVHITADTNRPNAAVIIDDVELHADETATVTFVFSEAVSGFTLADVTVANGSLSDLASSDGLTWTATFTPAAGVADASNLISLNLAGVVDVANNAGSVTTNSANFTINTVRPTATVAVTDTALKAGETTAVTITFSEAVSGFSNADLTVEHGTVSNVTSGDGGITWTATLTPNAGVTDATNLVTLDNAGVTNAVGNAGAGTTSSNIFAIDTAPPTATVAVAEQTLGVGQTSLVTIAFSEAVTGFSLADLTVANGTLSGLSSSDGGVTWTATLTPAAATTDPTNTIVLDNAGVMDAAGNVGVGTTISDNYALDATPPTATVHVADAALTAGETSQVIFTFSEAVTGFANADLTVEHGTLSAVTTSDGGVTWTATFTPDAALTDATNTITLDNVGVADLAGNVGSGTTVSNNYAIDTIVPPPALPTDFFGTAGPDRIIGNALDNLIDPGDGDDTVMGGGGADTVLGGAGGDGLQGNTGADSLAGGAGTDTILGGQDNDRLQGNSGDDRLSGDKGDDVVFGGQDNDTVQGGEGDDMVSGDRGDDVVLGGQGDDVVLGGDGDDLLSGDRGSDTLTGGAGADLFHSFGDAGLDLITDFDAAEGDRLWLEPGAAYTLGQSGADVVVSLAGGARIVLADVQLSSLADGWISA